MGELFANGHALVIGVANYPSASVLPDAVLQDARDIARLLCSEGYCGYPPGNVELLLDEQATLARIRAGFDRLARESKADDTVVIFFSGHGARSKAGSGSYLIPFDLDPGRISETALPAAELTAFLRAIKAKRVVAIFDACHAAGAGDVKKIVEPGLGLKGGLDEKLYVKLAKGAGRAILASSREDEVSRVLQGMNNSLFTHYLLEALGGHARDDGTTIGILDVFDYVSKQVPTRAAQQHPVFKAEIESNFPVALAPRKKATQDGHRDPAARADTARIKPAVRLALQKSLVTRWSRLAVHFDVPLEVRARLKKEDEPSLALFDWLEETGKLKPQLLFDAFRDLEWNDLLEKLDSPR